MSHDPRRRDLKRATVALQAYEASRSTVSAFSQHRLDDLIERATAYRDQLRREVGDPPSARERRS